MKKTIYGIVIGIAIAYNTVSAQNNGIVSFVTPVIEKLCTTSTSFALYVNYTTAIQNQKVIIDFTGPNNTNIRTAITPPSPETKSDIPFTINIPANAQPLVSGIYKATLFLRHTNASGGGVFTDATSIDIPVMSCGTHPFLLVKKEMYPAIRKKDGAGNPFNYIINASRSRWHDVNKSVPEALNYCIIMYIMETNETAKASIRSRIMNILKKWEQAIPSIQNRNNKSYVAFGTTSQFNAIIAIDMIHDALSAADLVEAERILAVGADFFIKTDANWKLSGYGVNLLYALYSGNESEITKWKNAYDDYLLNFSITDDGSWGQSPGYFYARIGGSRIAKTTIVDVLEFTERGSYYNNPQLVEAYRWGATFGATPWGGFTTFGDTGHNSNRMKGTLSPHFSAQYGTDIAANYYWNLRSTGPHSFNASNWIMLLKKPVTAPTPVMPKSLLKEQSGAALWDRTDSQQALQGVLYSLKRDNPAIDQFTHDLYDANSFDIIGYGEHMVMNSGVSYTGLNGEGFNYPGYAPDNGRWFRSTLQNTVLIGNKTEHDQRDGGGLIDGIVGGKVEFGTTAAGPAINNGVHNRTLHFVHPIIGNSNGYFVIHDEVIPNKASDGVAINFQVNTKRNGTIVVEPNQEYTAPIHATPVQVNDTKDKVTLFFGSNPDISIVNSYKGTFAYQTASDNIKANYATATDGAVRATTVIFPEDESHTKPNMEKITNANFSGVKLSHKSTFVDQYIGANPSVENTHDGVTFKANTTFFRKENGKISMYSSTNGTKFLVHSADQYGYESTNAMSIVMEDNTGYYHAKNNTDVTFYKKNLIQIKIDGQEISPIRSFSNAIKVPLKKGRFKIELITSPILSNNKFDNENQVLIFPNPVDKEPFFTIQLRKKTISTISIIDLQGRVVYEKQYDAKQIHLNKDIVHGAAMYFARIKQGKRMTIKKILIK